MTYNIAPITFTKISRGDEVVFVVFLAEDWTISIDDLAHTNAVALFFNKNNEKDKIEEIENRLNINCKVNGSTTLGQKKGIKINPNFTIKITFSSISMSAPSGRSNLAKFSNISISPSANPSIYDIRNQVFNFTVKTIHLNFNHGEETLIFEIEDQKVMEAFSQVYFPVKKIVFRNNPLKLAELHEIANFNFNQGEKKFTLENIENYPPVKKWEALELDLSPSLLNGFANITLKGELTKPTTPNPDTPPNGPDIPDRTQLRDQAKSAIQDELNIAPKTENSELGQNADWENKLIGLDTEDKISNFKNSLIAEIKNIRIRKESDNDPIKQAIDNLTDRNQKTKANQLWGKLIAAEDLVRQGKFDQKIYDELSAEKNSNSAIYQIINQEGRLDKLLINLKRIKEGDNGSNNQQAQKNGNSTLKLIIGGGAIVLVIFITAAVIWKSKKKKKNYNSLNCLKKRMSFK